MAKTVEFNIAALATGLIAITRLTTEIRGFASSLDLLKNVRSPALDVVEQQLTAIMTAARNAKADVKEVVASFGTAPRAPRASNAGTGSSVQSGVDPAAASQVAAFKAQLEGLQAVQRALSGDTRKYTDDLTRLHGELLKNAAAVGNDSVEGTKFLAVAVKVQTELDKVATAYQKANTVAAAFKAPTVDTSSVKAAEAAWKAYEAEQAKANQAALSSVPAFKSARDSAAAFTAESERLRQEARAVSNEIANTRLAFQSLPGKATAAEIAQLRSSMEPLIERANALKVGLRADSDELKLLSSATANAHRSVTVAEGGITRLGLSSQVTAGIMNTGITSQIAMLIPGGQQLKGVLSGLASGGLTPVGAAAALAAVALAGVGIGIANGIGVAQKYQQEMGGITSVVKLSGDELKKFQDNLDAINTGPNGLPVTSSQLNAVARDAVLFGVTGVQGITTFTKTIAQLGVVTRENNKDMGDLAQMGQEVAIFLNETGVTAKNYSLELSKVAASLAAVDAVTPGSIQSTLQLSKFMASGAVTLGLTRAQIIGVAGALSGLGANAEAGGSSVIRVITAMKNSTTVAFGDIGQKIKDGSGTLAYFTDLVHKGGQPLAQLVGLLGQAGQGFVKGILAGGKSAAGAMDTLEAKVKIANARFENLVQITGASRDSLKKMIDTNPAGALQLLAEGLNKVHERGGDMAKTLASIGAGNIRDVRLIDQLIVGHNALATSLKASAEATKNKASLDDRAKEATKNNIDQNAILANTFNQVARAVGNAFLPGLALMTKTLAANAPAILAWAKGFSASAGPAITGFVKGVISIVEAIKPLLPVVEFVIGAVTARIRGIIQIISGVVQVVASIIKGNWAGAWNGFLQILSGAFLVALASVGKWVVSFGEKLVAGAASWLTNFAPAGTRIVLAFTGKMLQAGTSSIGGVMGRIGQMILGPISGIAGKMLAAGRDLVLGFVKGITGNIGAIGGAIASMAEQTVGFVRNKFDWHSPMGISVPMGRDFVGGWAKGMGDLTPVETQAVRLRQALINATRVQDFSGIVQARAAIQEFANTSKYAHTVMQAVTQSLPLHGKAHADAAVHVAKLTEAQKAAKKAAGDHARGLKSIALTDFKQNLADLTDQELLDAQAKAKATADANRYADATRELASRAKQAEEAQAKLTEEIVKGRIELAKAVAEAQIGDGVQATISAVERGSGAFSSYQDAMRKLFDAGVTLTVPLLDALKKRFDAVTEAQKKAVDIIGSRGLEVAVDSSPLERYTKATEDQISVLYLLTGEQLSAVATTANLERNQKLLGAIFSEVERRARGTTEAIADMTAAQIKAAQAYHGFDAANATGPAGDPTAQAAAISAQALISSGDATLAGLRDSEQKIQAGLDSASAGLITLSGSQRAFLESTLKVIQEGASRLEASAKAARAAREAMLGASVPTANSGSVSPSEVVTGQEERITRLKALGVTTTELNAALEDQYRILENLMTGVEKGGPQWLVFAARLATVKGNLEELFKAAQVASNLPGANVNSVTASGIIAAQEEQITRLKLLGTNEKDVTEKLQDQKAALEILMSGVSAFSPEWLVYAQRLATVKGSLEDTGKAALDLANAQGSPLGSGGEFWKNISGGSQEVVDVLGRVIGIAAGGYDSMASLEGGIDDVSKTLERIKLGAIIATPGQQAALENYLKQLQELRAGIGSIDQSVKTPVTGRNARNDAGGDGQQEAQDLAARAAGYALLSDELERNAQVALDDVAAFDALMQVQEAADQAEQSLGQTTEDVGKKFVGVIAGLGRLKDKYPELTDQIDELIAKYEKLDGILASDAAITKSQDAFEKLHGALEAGTITEAEYETGVQNLIRLLEAQAIAAAAAGQSTVQLEFAIAQLQARLTSGPADAATAGFTRLMTGIQQVAAWVKQAANAIKSFAEGGGKDLGGLVSSFGQIGGSIAEAVTGIPGLGAVVSGVIDAFVAVAEAAVSVVVGANAKIAESGHKAAEEARAAATEFGGAFTKLGDEIDAASNIAGDFWTNLFNKGWANANADLAKNLTESLGIAKGIFQSVGSSISSAVEEGIASGDFTQAGVALEDKLQKLYLKNMIEAATAAALTAAGIDDLVIQLGKAIADGDTAKVDSLFQEINGKAQKVFKTVAGGFQKFAGQSKIKLELEAPKGSIAAIDKQITALRDKFNKATDQATRDSLKAEITTLEAEKKRLEGDTSTSSTTGSTGTGATGNNLGLANAQAQAIIVQLPTDVFAPLETVLTRLTEAISSFSSTGGLSAGGIDFTKFDAATLRFDSSTNRFDTAVLRFEAMYSRADRMYTEQRYFMEGLFAKYAGDPQGSSANPFANLTYSR